MYEVIDRNENDNAKLLTLNNPKFTSLCVRNDTSDSTIILATGSVNDTSYVIVNWGYARFVTVQVNVCDRVIGGRGRHGGGVGAQPVGEDPGAAGARRGQFAVDNP